MKRKAVELLVCVLFVVSACDSSSTKPQSQITASDAPEGGDNSLRISSLSESIDSFEGVYKIGWI